ADSGRRPQSGAAQLSEERYLPLTCSPMTGARSMSVAARLVVALLTLYALSRGGPAVAQPGATVGMQAVLEDGRLYLAAPPRTGEGLYAFARRMTGGVDGSERIAEANGRPQRLLRDRRYRVPYALLTDKHKVATLQAIFAEDSLEADGWHHRVDPRRQLGLWQLAEWFTGNGANFATVRRHNGLADNELPAGGIVVIPAALLIEPLRALLPTPVVIADASAAASGAPTDGAESAAANGQLSYLDGADADHALYRLRAGEALYSAVVVRFTGRVGADDVNELAEELAKLNGIEDVTDMPVGQPVKIPFDLLLPEFLPPNDRRRIEWEANRTETAKYSNPVLAARLDGITIVLDAGHGGGDPGADVRGVWESIYVYDVMVRVKSLLEETTGARVRTTTRDGDSYRIHDQDVLPTSRRHVVLTNPPYAIQDARVSANLRWYLTNSLHRRAVEASGDPDKTLFLSIHADSLHPSLRGAMAYVPATGLTSGTYGKSGTVYASRREVKERPRVSFSWKERTRSEGLSRQFAEDLLKSFRRHQLAVHNEKPIRDRIIRCRRCRPFVPAVIRRNAVPTKVLLEVCNLNNPEDRRLIKTQAYRQEVAAAIVDAILDYYGQSRDRPPVATARARR
ncbi:MAG: N-acetylmuramoyl-L-alanine amidase, partial [Acidobacteriota bacterium]